MKLEHKNKQLEKLEQDKQFIPCSARIDFQLRVSHAAEESKEYIVLKEETEAHLEEVRNTLKTKIIEATKIEIKVTLEEVREEFFVVFFFFFFFFFAAK